MEPSKRKVVTRSPWRTVRLIHLPHIQSEAIEAESSWERDFVHIAALFPYTQSIRHQPFQLTLSKGKYTPDFLVGFLDRTHAVVEVKPRERAAGFSEDFAETRLQLATRSMSFVVAQEDELHHADRASRALQIRRYSKSFCSERDSALAIQLVRESACGIAISDLIKQGIQRPTILHLMSRHRLKTSKHLDIDDAAIVTMVQPTEEPHATLFVRWLDVEAR